jgi:hypothetical protein
MVMEELLPGGIITQAFEGAIDLSAEGDYIIEATVNLAGDLRLTNDTSEYQIFRYAKPVIDFGFDETEYVEDISLDIDAGYHNSYAYQWQDTSWHESLYTATVSGLCHVKVTDTRTGCFDGDSVMVILIYSDVGVTFTSLPAEACAGEFEDVVVRVSNLGPSAIGSEAPIYVACDVNGVRVIIDTLTREEGKNFNPGANLDLHLSGVIPVTGEGISTITFYTIFAQDKKLNNDSMDMEFNALPVPVIDFGDLNGNLTVELPHTLDAGAGNQSYLWQDNSTGQTFNVTQNGTYSVMVTGMNDCQATKTVNINMESAVDENLAGEITLYPNPNHGSFRIKAIDIKGDLMIRILNNSGQLLYNRKLKSDELNNEMINVQHLPRGIYYLQILAEGIIKTTKLVID